MIKFILKYINNGPSRSVIAKKNIVALVGIKSLSIAISILFVSLTLRYVDSVTYGIWLTLSSIIAWLSFFNVGLNNGLRNRFAEARANNNLELAQKYVSTTYGLLTLIFVPLLIIFAIANQWLSWSRILNTPAELEPQLKMVSLIVVSYFCFRFILNSINVIMLADQKPAAEALRGLIEQVATLIVIIALIKLTSGSLIKLSLALCMVPLVVLGIFNISLFQHTYQKVRPKYSLIDFRLSKDLLGLGLRFFVIQIAGIIQFQTANFIIIQNYGAEAVTAYNIAFKYFGVLIMVMGITIAPLWSAVTEAYTKMDYNWITAAVKKYLNLSLLLSICGIFMLILANRIYEIWIGKNVVEISFPISFWMLIYATINMIGSVFVGVLNGIGALKIQFYLSIISSTLFIFLIILFVKVFNWGVQSVIIATVLANYNAFIAAPIQYYKIFKQNKQGVWSA